MTKRTALSPLACTAIAAVLAVAPTTVFAQETAVPDPAPASSAPAPARIVIPELRAAPVVQAVPEPVAEPQPVARATAVTKAAARPAPRQTARTAISAAAAPVAPEAVAPAATPLADASPIAVPMDVPPVAAVDTAAQPVVMPADDNTATLGACLLGLVALGGAGAYAFARRRRRVNEPVVTYSDERMAAPAPAIPASVSAPLMFERGPGPATIATTDAGSAIPPGPLPTGLALAELFERMARAAPDAENPFKGTKRRRQRVRWLMKQHEYRLRDAGDKFDYRHYTTGIKSAEREGARREFVPA